MFIQKMNCEELVKEYKRDKPEIERNNERIDKSAYVSNLLNKHRKEKEVTFVRKQKTSNNNTYLNVFQYQHTSESTRKSVKWEWRVYSFGLMQTPKGLATIGFFENAGIAIVFQSHFFLRYKERFMEVCDWKTRAQLAKANCVEDIIPIYIQRNPDAIWMNTKCKFGDREHVFAPINDGVALIQFNGASIQANTFITEDMYSDKQAEMVEKSKYFEQLQEEKNKLYEQIISILNKE